MLTLVSGRRRLAAAGGTCLATLALLAGCGGQDQAKPLPAATARTILARLDEVGRRVDARACNDAKQDSIPALHREIDSLPSSVDDSVRAALDDGVSHLEDLVNTQCKKRPRPRRPRPTPTVVPTPQPETPQRSQPERQTPSVPSPTPQPPSTGNSTGRTTGGTTGTGGNTTGTGGTGGNTTGTGGGSGGGTTRGGTTGGTTGAGGPDTGAGGFGGGPASPAGGAAT